MLVYTGLSIVDIHLSDYALYESLHITLAPSAVIVTVEMLKVPVENKINFILF